MPTVKFKDVKASKDYLKKINGRYKADLHQFVKYCHNSGIIICPQCYSYDTKPLKIEKDSVLHVCVCCEHEFWKRS